MSWEYNVGVFGGVKGTPSGRYRAIVSIMLADEKIYVIESTTEFDTSEQAEREYDSVGRALFAECVEALKKLGGYLLEGAMSPGSFVPICPLKEDAVFKTSAFITQAHFCAAMTPSADQLLAALPPLAKENPDDWEPE